MSERRGPARQVFSAYTALSLASPTLVGSVLTLVDQPTLTWAWAAVVTGILALAVQQFGWLVASDAWPTSAWSRLRLPRVFTSVPALAVGVLGGSVVQLYGLGQGRPILIWVIPAAAALGVLALAVTRWEREVPRWSAAAVALVAGLGVVVVATALWGAERSGGSPREAALGLGIATAIIIVVLLVQVGQVWWQRVVTELTRARESLVAAAVTDERLRFAGELHDLQGHELQVILLRADAGQTMLRIRGATALPEAIAAFQQIRDAAAATLQQTREIAHGYRKVGFAQEVANTRPLLAAAGIAVDVRGPVGEIAGELAHLAGLLVREATTNLLRHTRSTSVAIEIAPVGTGYAVSVTDAGPRRERGPGTAPGSGLASLDERARRVGYRVTSGPHGEGWSVALRPLPEQTQAHPPSPEPGQGREPGAVP